MAPPSFWHSPARLLFLLLLLTATATPKAALQIPTRPTTFPLSRPSLAGDVIAWGSNNFGQLTIPPSATNVVAIAAGPRHNLALRADGTVVAWGDNQSGQCDVPPSLNNVVSVAAGMLHSLALKGDGTVVAWGINDSRVNLAQSGVNIVGIAANEFASYALNSNGTAVRWADNVPNQFYSGSNIVLIKGIFDDLLYVQSDGRAYKGSFGPATPWGVTDIARVGASRFNFAFIRTDGVVYPDSTDKTPVGLKATSVACTSYYYSYAAIREDSTVAVWSFDDRLPSNLTNIPPRLRSVIAIEGGESHFIALRIPDAPIPTTAIATAQIVNGFIVALNIIDGGEGYAEPPNVTITGGGGTGATATAQITKGIVTGFTMINAGSGYTGTPTITLDPPPFLPTLGISPSRVNVTMQVVPGKRYLLESATELPNFSAIGQPFVAQANTITNEFIINQTGQFFRVQEVP